MFVGKQGRCCWEPCSAELEASVIAALMVSRLAAPAFMQSRCGEEKSVMHNIPAGKRKAK